MIRITIRNYSYPEQSGHRAKANIRPPEEEDTVIMKQQTPMSLYHLLQRQEQTQISLIHFPGDPLNQ